MQARDPVAAGVTLQASVPLRFVAAAVARDWRALSGTLIACSLAAVVATFQWSVYRSFVRTGAVVPRMLGGDVWISAATVECFDFPDPISEDYASALARFLPGVRFRRVVFGFAPWRSPTGRRGNVAVVGVDNVGLADDEFVADRTDLARLDLMPDAAGRVQEASISDTTLRFAHATERFPTFLGAPYILVPFERGRELLRMDPTTTSFLIGDSRSGAGQGVQQIPIGAQRQFPEVTIVGARQFADGSSTYWQRKTGAGMAILLAAVLAGLLMCLLLVNGVSRFIQRYHHDLLSLLGHGADTRDVGSIIAVFAAIVAAATGVVAAVATPLIVYAVAPLLPWVRFDPTDALTPLAGVVLALGVAVFLARRDVTAFGPEAVFRT